MSSDEDEVTGARHYSDDEEDNVTRKRKREHAVKSKAFIDDSDDDDESDRMSNRSGASKASRRSSPGKAKKSGKKRRSYDDEDDEEEEEDDEEDEEDDEAYARKRAKKRKSGVGGFILEEAEVDDEVEEEDEWEEGAEQYNLGNDHDEHGPTARDIEGSMRRHSIWDSQKEEELEKYLRQKYADEASAQRHFGDGGEDMSDEITQQTFLPGIKDPSLWMVKCRLGEEKYTCLQLMRKAIAYSNNNEPLQIKSVIAPEGIKGYVYIEAFKQTHVKNAIEGISNLRMGLYKQQMVPITEMTDVLRVTKEQTGLKAGANITRLKDETGVIISVQDSAVATGPSVIHLEGSRVGVERAAAAILEQVEKLEGEKEKDLIIEHRFHGNLIGAKGEKIREIREQFNQVQITFPTPEEKRDVVKVRGPKEDVDKCCRHLNQIYKEMLENSYQIKVPIFSQCYRLVVGKGGANIKKIREETNTRFDLPPLDESKGRTDVEMIMITGKRENCEKARDMLLSIQNSAANIIEVDVMIPSKFHNFLIGSGGRIVQSLSEECGGVQIKFPDSKSKSDRVTITGPKEDVEKAKNQLLELSRERETNSYTESIEAKAQHHKFLIGKNGGNIKKIRESTGARIIFPSNDDPHPETITIMGKKENVINAKKQLQDMLKDLDKVVEAEMNIDPQYHRHFVLRRGEVLRYISDELGGVQISFPKVNSNSNRVTLKGAAECVEAAKKRLEAIVEDLSQRVTIDVIIDQRHHRTIMGSQGSKVKQIQSDHNVDIKFPERVDEHNIPEENGDGIRPCDIIRVSGRLENCEAAKASLLDQVPVTIEVDIPFKMHRFVIGQSGKDVRALMKVHDVHITVPPSEQQSDTIKITGSPRNAESAKVALLKLKEDLEAKERDREAKSFEVRVQVDPKFHTKIIGKNGAVIGKIRETYDVNVQLPKRGDNLAETSDEIVIIGYEDQANRARDEILSIVNDLVERERFREEAKIDHRVHSRIIGAKGKNVRQIMKDYGVDIRFPRANDEDPDLVVISGPNEDKVLDAREHLLNLEEEYLQDVTENEYMQRFIRSSNQGNESNKKSEKQSNGFVVKGAPWEAPDTQSTEHFPTFGNGMSSGAPAPAPPAAPERPINSAWGGRKHF